MAAHKSLRKGSIFRWTALLLVAMFATLMQTVTGASVAASKKTVQHNVDTTTPRIVVPLYIYPTPNAWDPLYTAIRNNPTAAFTVIINPNSGPGTSKNPPSDYASAIKQLRATAGVNQILELVGYVATGYGKRSAAKVQADVAKYAGWQDAVRPDGIFFDETSTQTKWLKRYAEYTDLVKNTNWAKTSASKSTSSAKFSQKATNVQRSAITILNPGTWPEDKGFFTISADHIVVYEDKLSNFK